MFETTILILAAGYNKRSDKPCSLWSFGNGKSILDWQISAFRTAIPKNKINIAIGHNFKKMYMTSFLQLFINAGWMIMPAHVNHGWLEIDTAEDLKLYEKLSHNKKLDYLWKVHE